MYRKFHVLTIVMLALAALGVFVATAQDATVVPTLDPAIQPTVDPAAQPTLDTTAGEQATPAQGVTTLAEPEFIGDPNQQSAQVAIGYLQSRDPNLLAEDAEFFDLTTGQPTVGREAITQMQNDFFGQAFTGTLVQPVRVITADNGWVVIEFNFSGTQTGTFRNTPGTNLPVSVPMAGVFHVENGLITNARVYYDAATINQQLGVMTTSGVSQPGQTSDSGGAITATNPQNLDLLLDNPAQFYGQTVTVEGNVSEFFNERMVLVTDDDVIAPESLLVLHSNNGALDATTLQRVQVTGTIQPFVLADFEAQFGMDLDDALFIGFENQPVIIADTITPVQQP